MLFGIEHLTNVPRSYILFEASQYDTAGYLFTNPKFISLDANARPGSIALRGMRIGLNGSEPAVGQAYRLLNTTITDQNYSATTGQTLSTVGTIIGVERGPMLDEFYLCFDQLGSRSNVCSAYANVAAPSRQILSGSDIGVRTFDEINASMAKLTGVDPNVVGASYREMRASLPATPDIQAFLGSNQASISQLAVEYCDAMTNNVALRPGFFGAYNFAPPLNIGNASALVNPVVDKVMGVGLSTQPQTSAVRDELGTLVHGVCRVDGVDGCATNADVVIAAKAVCVAMLGSAITVVK
jgi:hypothetical protein